MKHCSDKLSMDECRSLSMDIAALYVPEPPAAQEPPKCGVKDE
jgi:hypothetical protein